jgi:glutaconate CoA-transferase subunit B
VQRVFVTLRHSRRAFVEELDFRTSAGDRVAVVVTDLGILEPDPATRELTLTSVHPGVGVDEVREATGWDLRVADSVGETREPSEQELGRLRALKTKGRE